MSLSCIYNLNTFDLSVILHTTEAVMALHSIFKPLAPKKYPQLSE